MTPNPAKYIPADGSAATKIGKHMMNPKTTTLSGPQCEEGEG